MKVTQAGLMKMLLEAGVHFGHQARHWNPKMAPYIFGKKNDIYIIDLQLTANAIIKACEFLRSVAKSGGYVLFAGTKKQAQEIIKKEAERCDMFYVNQRWLGGCLTNFQTVRKSVKRLNDLERMKEEKIFDKLSKKEVSQLTREMLKLKKNLEGIRKMERLPQAFLIVDSKKEHIAIREAKKLSIPVVALVDTNCNPDLVDHIIPGNDDAIKSIRLIVGLLTDAIEDGRKEFLSGKEKEELMEKLKEESAEAVSEEEVEKLITEDDVKLEEETKKEEKTISKKQPAPKRKTKLEKGSK